MDYSERKKVLFVASVTKKHICQFHIPYMKMLQEWGYEVHVCAANDYNEGEVFQIPNCDNYYDVCFSRNPLSLRNIKAYCYTKKIIKEGSYDLIHCHTPIAAAITRIAARKSRDKTTVLYTAHGFHFHKRAPIRSIFFYCIEKCLARITDGIITVNSEDYNCALRMCKNMSCDVYYIPGIGVRTDMEKYSFGNRAEIKRALGIPEDSFIVLSVSELNKNKNLSTTIQAVGKIKDDSIYYVICGEGNMSNEYKRLAIRKCIDNHVVFTGYRYDVFSLLKISDLFLFPSLREGLGMAPLEAMSVGIPIIASDIRGVREYGIDGYNGILLDPNDVSGFADAITKLKKDEDYRYELGRHAIESAKRFDINLSLQAMSKIYLEYLNIG